MFERPHSVGHTRFLPRIIEQIVGMGLSNTLIIAREGFLWVFIVEDDLYVCLAINGA